MGRQNSDATAMHSSIALLQERFRQLQRVKEIREERELLRLFWETERVSPTTRHEPSRLFIHPEFIIPTTTPMQGSFSFPPESQSKYDHYQSVDTPLLMSLWPTDRNMPRRPNILDDAEVDTSLHL